MPQAIRKGAPLLVVALLGLVCGCSKSKTPQGRPSNGPEFGQVGNVLLAKSPGPVKAAKVIVASFTFSDQGVQPGQVVASFGSPEFPSFAAGDYEMSLLGPSGETLISYPIPNPRTMIVEHRGMVREGSTLYAARFPFRINAASARVSDIQGKKLAEISVASVVREFCGRVKDDPDCQPSQPPPTNPKK